MPAKCADFQVGHRPRETVRADQINISQFHRERTFEVNFHGRLGPEAACNHVLGNGEIGLFGSQMIAPHQFPDQAVIKRKLVDPARTHAVDAGISNVGNQHPLGQEQEGRASRSHALEVAIGGGPVVNQRADFLKGLDDCF